MKPGSWILSMPTSFNPNKIIKIPLIKDTISLYLSKKGLIVSTAKASIKKIKLSPRTKHNEFKKTSNLLSFLSVAKYDIYKGIIGSTQGDKKDNKPSINKPTKVIS